MPIQGDILFGRFSGQSKLRQGDGFVRLTPEPSGAGATSQLALLAEAVELEGSFGLVSGTLDGNVLFDAEIEEVIPPVLSGVLDRLLDEGTLDRATLLPTVQAAIRSLLGRPAQPPAEGPLCALVVGHRPSAKGAFSNDQSVSEFDFNLALAREIETRARRARVEIVLRENTPEGRRKLPAQINAKGPHFILSLHCNSADAVASGTETLFFHRSTRGHELAKIVQRRVVKALELRNRFTKPRTEVQRGGHLLKFTKAPCVICEPFFINNDGDLDRATRRRIGLANAYAAAIDEAAGVFGSGI